MFKLSEEERAQVIGASLIFMVIVLISIIIMAVVVHFFQYNKAGYGSYSNKQTANKFCLLYQRNSIPEYKTCNI